jgi:hypothetical protein
VDRHLYHLDPNFEWWWSVTRLQAKLLAEGYSVQAIRSFTEIVHHGGGSGPVPSELSGMDTPITRVREWFHGLPPVDVIGRLDTS